MGIGGGIEGGIEGGLGGAMRMLTETGEGVHAEMLMCFAALTRHHFTLRLYLLYYFLLKSRNSKCNSLNIIKYNTK